MMQAVPFPLHSLTVGRGAARVPHIFAHERILDAEDHIGVQILVTSRKQVRDKPAVPRRLDEKMNMLGSKGVTPLGLEHLAHRAIMWNRVGRWSNAPQIKTPVCARVKSSSPGQL